MDPTDLTDPLVISKIVDDHISFDMWLNNLDNEVEQLRNDYDAVIAQAEQLLEKSSTVYEIKRNNEWIVVGRLTFEQWNGLRKINGLNYVGAVKPKF